VRLWYTVFSTWAAVGCPQWSNSMRKGEFEAKLKEAETLLKEEWDYVNPRDIVIGFMCLWKISEGAPAMAEVWAKVKKRLPKFTAKIEEAWPRGDTTRSYRQRARLRDAYMDQLFDKLSFQPNPYLRAQQADSCYLKACRKFNIRPKRRAGAE
jgi:hypothetical protein